MSGGHGVLYERFRADKTPPSSPDHEPLLAAEWKWGENAGLKMRMDFSDVGGNGDLSVKSNRVRTPNAR
jgi:hypothetical protein